jgi:hypothetical protein
MVLERLHAVQTRNVGMTGCVVGIVRLFLKYFFGSVSYGYPLTHRSLLEHLSSNSDALVNMVSTDAALGEFINRNDLASEEKIESFSFLTTRL